jgi:hypothetical protein
LTPSAPKHHNLVPQTQFFARPGNTPTTKILPTKHKKEMTQHLDLFNELIKLTTDDAMVFNYYDSYGSSLNGILEEFGYSYPFINNEQRQTFDPERHLVGNGPITKELIEAILYLPIATGCLFDSTDEVIEKLNVFVFHVNTIFQKHGYPMSMIAFKPSNTNKRFEIEFVQHQQK